MRDKWDQHPHLLSDNSGLCPTTPVLTTHSSCSFSSRVRLFSIRSPQKRDCSRFCCFRSMPAMKPRPNNCTWCRSLYLGLRQKKKKRERTVTAARGKRGILRCTSSPSQPGSFLTQRPGLLPVYQFPHTSLSYFYLCSHQSSLGIAYLKRPNLDNLLNGRRYSLTIHLIRG